MNDKENSPFTPGSPVSAELFVGRSAQVEDLLKFAKQAANGKQENVFLVGDRGIGKSSLASFLRTYVINQMNMVGIHVFLGGELNLDEMVRHIFDQLLKETQSQSWFKNIASFFGSYIKEVGLFGVSASFNPPKDNLKELVRNFPSALNNLCIKISDQKKGIFIALDDINGLANKQEFADWYKSFVDHVATHNLNLPIFIVLIGLPEKRDSLSKLQPSLMRIFRIVEIEKLTNDEVTQFIRKAFKQANVNINNQAIEFMAKYSSGLPLLMHEIGDATFWADKDNNIDVDDAIKGVIDAAEKIGQKYLDPKAYRAIRSERYRSILRKLSDAGMTRHFEKRNIEEKLNINEKKVFHNFLRRLNELGVIEQDIERGRGRGAYRYVNAIYPIYIHMESTRAKSDK